MPVQDSQGTVFKIGTDVVGEITGFSGFGPGQTSMRDRTTLADTARRRFGKGLADTPEVSFNMLLATDDAGQRQAYAAVESKTTRSCTLVLEQGVSDVTLTFSAWIMAFNFSGDRDADMTATMTIKVDGAISGFPAAS